MRGVVRPAGSSGTGEWGFPMDASMMFLDLSSTDGALESARIRCPRGHWFNGPIESLTFGERPSLADEKSATRGSRR